MKTLRTAFAAVVLAAALGACGTAGDAAPPAGQAAPSEVAGSVAAPPAQPGGQAPAAAPGDEEQVAAAFRSYYQALLARDYTTACAINAPETTTALIGALAQQGVTVGTCEEAFSTVYSIPGATETADGIARTARVEGVTVNGDSAVVSWSAESDGARNTEDIDMSRIDGRWRLLVTAGS